METVGTIVDWNGQIGSAANTLYARLGNRILGRPITVAIVIDRFREEVRLTIHGRYGTLYGSATVPGAIPDTLTATDLNVLSGVPGGFKSFAWKKGTGAALQPSELSAVSAKLIGTL